MKKYILIVLITLCVNSEKLFAQADPAYDSIARLNLDNYASKPIDSLLKVIPKSYASMTIIGSLTSNNAIGLSIYYPGGMNIWIQPLAYNYMTQNDPNRVWDLNLLKKERASNISVMHSDFKPLFGQYP